MSDEAHGPFSRRGLMLGAGAAAAVVGTALAGAQPAAAEPGNGKTAVGNALDPTVDGSPVDTSLGSAAQSGFTYRTVSMFDFTPEASASPRAWGGYGTYTANAASFLWASIEIPAGALIRGYRVVRAKRQHGAGHRARPAVGGRPGEPVQHRGRRHHRCLGLDHEDPDHRAGRQPRPLSPLSTKLNRRNQHTERRDGPGQRVPSSASARVVASWGCCRPRSRVLRLPHQHQARRR